VLNVALTGNAAAGKSTVAAWFRQWGATLIDADDIVRELERPGAPVLAQIVARFGRAVLAPDGALDRTALRRLILKDPARREALNAIVHPAVEIERDARLRAAAARGDRIVVNDIPLLFEALDPAAFDLVVLVDAPEPVRRTRLRERGLAVDEIDRLLAAQLPPEGKRARSHIVLDNGGTLAELERAARKAWQQIAARAA
jgi:dephospho-CoA kinase